MKKNSLVYFIVIITLSLISTGCSNPVGLTNESHNIIKSRNMVLDNVAPSQNPPGGLRPDQVPMLVSFGFDDNAYCGLEESGETGGMTWCLDLFKNRVNNGIGNPATFDKTPVKASFYFSTTNIDNHHGDFQVLVKRAWRRAYLEGHEVGNHTQSHTKPGRTFSLAKWTAEIETCHEWLTKPYKFNPIIYQANPSIGIGVPGSEIVGFRTPFLEFNSNTMTAVQNMGYLYDCSVNEGFQSDQDGTNNYYPYTLDNGSPGNDVSVGWNQGDEPIGNHPGLWEMPLYAVIVPPDDKCVEYGVSVGLRNRLKDRLKFYKNFDWDADAGKITGLDYNMFFSFDMSKEEFLATMKYTFDLRFNGNRAPLMFGAHSEYFSSKSGDTPYSTYLDRQEALKEFVDYVMSKEAVRVVPVKKVLEWMKNPEPLHTAPLENYDVFTSVDSGQGTISPSGNFTTQQYSNVEFTLNPALGQKIGEVLVNGSPVQVVNMKFTVSNIRSNTAISVLFTDAPTYTVSSEVEGNGTLSPSGNSLVTEGDNMTFTLTYGSDTRVKQLLVNNVDQLVGNTITSYKVTDITENTTVKVIYGPYIPEVEAEYKITSDWGTGFRGEVIITNKTSETITSWKLSWDYLGNQQVTFDSAITKRDGKSVVVLNKSWNGTIASGAMLKLGFDGTYTGINDKPDIIVE